MSHLIALALVAGVATTPERLAADLGSPAFAARERATERLWRAGELARPALEAAAKSADPEAARRAADLLDRFDWGLYADTAPDVRTQVNKFRAGVPDDQDAAVAALVRADELPTIRKLLARPRPAADNQRLAGFLLAFLRREVPPLIAAGDRDRAGERLALHAVLPDLAGLIDLTVFEHLRGKPEPTAPPSPLLDVCRRRAAGDRAGAYQAAAPYPDLQSALLEDAGDYAALADRPIRLANSGDGLKAFRLRRAGRPAEATAILDEQLDLGLGRPRLSAQQLDEPTLALVLNDRVADAIARLTDKQYAPHILADWLTAQLRFADALDLVRPDRERGQEFDDAFYRGLAGTRRGRLLAMLGRKADATAAFQAAFKAARAGERADRLWAASTGYGLEQLVRAEVRAGRHDLACTHLGAALDADEDRRPAAERRGPAFEALFEADAEVGPALLAIIGRGDPAGDRLKRVRALLAGKGTAADLEAVTRCERPDPTSDPDRARVVGQAVAAALRAAGKPAAAAKVFEGVADALPPPDDDPPVMAGYNPPGAKSWVYGCDERIRFWVEFGDVLAGLGRHADAADRLFQGWRRFPDSPTLLFLSGRALAKAGKTADGKARMAAAHWVALGNPGPRGRLLEELVARGLVADADRERPLAGLAGWAGGPAIGNVWNQAAKAATLAGKHAVAAELYDRSLHYVLKTERRLLHRRVGVPDGAAGGGGGPRPRAAGGRQAGRGGGGGRHLPGRAARQHRAGHRPGRRAGHGRPGGRRRPAVPQGVGRLRPR